MGEAVEHRGVVELGLGSMRRQMTRLPQGGLARIAVHEASHAAAATMLGIEVLHASLTAKRGPHMHRGHYRPPAGVNGLEAMCILALAGPAGEAYLCGRVNDGGDATDIAMAREYLATHAAMVCCRSKPSCIGCAMPPNDWCARPLSRTASRHCRCVAATGRTERRGDWCALLI
jgi:hypothetical protein